MTTPTRDAAFAVLDMADWKEETREVVETIVRIGSILRMPFSSNDVRPWLPEDTNPNRVGRCFALAAEKGLIVKVGAETSSASSTHGKEVAKWTVVGDAA